MVPVCKTAQLNSNKIILNLLPEGFDYILHSFTQPVHSVVMRFAQCILYIYMYMPKSDAEKVTVRGSHGDSSLQRESDSFRVKRTVS